MPVTVTMPPLGDAISEATIERWLKAPGETVTKDEPLLELMSDKVTIEVPAPDDGRLETILVEAGQKVPTGTPLAIVALADESPTASSQPVAAPPTPAPPSSPPPVVSPPAAPTTPLPVTPPAPTPIGPATSVPHPAPGVASPPSSALPNGAGSSTTGQRLYSPRVRQLVADYGLTESELASLTGSGLGGRLTSDDLQAHLAQRPAPPPASRPRASAPAAPVLSSAPSSLPPVATGASALPTETRQPVTGLRRAIAEHMERSVASAPQAWQTVEINLQAVDQRRAAARAAFEATEGFGLTYLPFFVSALIDALRAVPALNAIWADHELIVKRELNLGVAVAIEGGLVVPVIVGADGLNLTGLARAIRDRAERARTNRLTATELSGGTITVNNTGAFGSILSRPIINQPQVAIVTMEAVVRRPVVTADDAIAIRPLVNACLSYDERAVDAATAGLFLSTLRQHLEEWSAPVG